MFIITFYKLIDMQKCKWFMSCLSCMGWVDELGVVKKDAKSNFSDNENGFLMFFAATLYLYLTA